MKIRVYTSTLTYRSILKQTVLRSKAVYFSKLQPANEAQNKRFTDKQTNKYTKNTHTY